MNHLCRFALMLTFTIFFAACSSTALTGTSRDPNFREKIRKVYIVGVTSQNIYHYDYRYKFEDVFSNEFLTQGITAIPSYKDGEFPGDFDQQKISDRAFANGADCILMAGVLGKNSGQGVNKIVILEVTLYETSTGKLIWSGQYEMAIDRSSELLLTDFAKAMFSDLRKNDLI